MTGAVTGDIVGSRFEFHNYRGTNFELFTGECAFTDDTVCTVAMADALLKGISFKESLLHWCRKYPNPKGAYGASFSMWVNAINPQPYNSFGNGSAMRVSPVGWAFSTLEETLDKAKESAEITHNHTEGIKGAQATVASIYLARTGSRKQQIKEYIETSFGYDLSKSCDEIRATYEFNESCQGTVPQAIVCFLESSDFESAIRLAVSIGGDSDTIAAITGSIAEAYYGIPKDIEQKAMEYLPDEFIDVIEQFKGYVR
jgi:ADP-ribosylglycohydrolase